MGVSWPHQWPLGASCGWSRASRGAGLTEGIRSVPAVDNCPMSQVRVRKKLRAGPSGKPPSLCFWFLGTLGLLTSYFSYLSLSLLTCKIGPVAGTQSDNPCHMFMVLRVTPL